MPHSDNLVLGKGKLYFEQFTSLAQRAPTGRRYRFIGNVPSFNVNQEIQTLDHFTSTGGVNVKDRSVTTQTDMGGQFTTDHIGARNLALLFGGTEGADTIGAATGLVETITGAQRDTYIQLGTTPMRPEGIGNIGTISCVIGSTTLVGGTDYDIDSKPGMLYLRDDGNVAIDGANVVVTYTTTAGSRNRVVDSANEIFGAIRFVSDNPVGDNRDFVFPYVKITASGDFGLITEEWQTMTFDFEVQAAGANSRRLTATSRYV